MKGERSRFLECDNYAICKTMLLERGTHEETVAIARAKGWHVYDGTTMNGSEHHAVLCFRCVGTSRSRLPAPPPVLDGQLQLDI
jgi:hypothetical protein